MTWQPMESAPRDGSEFVWLRRITIVAVGKPATYEFHACVMRRYWIGEERGLPREGEGFWMARYGGSVPDMDARNGWWETLPADGVTACRKCGQTDQGQTGEYACSECGLPTVWDGPVASPAHQPIAWLHHDHDGKLKLAQTEPPPDGAFPVFAADVVGRAPERWEMIGSAIARRVGPEGIQPQKLIETGTVVQIVGDAASGVPAVGPRCERCNDSGWHYADPLDPNSLEPCCEPSGKDGVMASDAARVQRLRDALEGECDGLAIDERHARAILEYVDGVGGMEAPDSVDLASLRGSVAYLRSVATTEGQRAALDNIERRARAAAGVMVGTIGVVAPPGFGPMTDAARGVAGTQGAQPVATAWMKDGEMVNAFPRPPCTPEQWARKDHDGYWSGKGYSEAPLYLHAPAGVPACDVVRVTEWPKERRVGRREDMSPTGKLEVMLDGDSDVIVHVCKGDTAETWESASVEFCTVGMGGGSSPRTRAALIALMLAIEADNSESPRKAWPPAEGRTSGVAPSQPQQPEEPRP